jgi:ABC-type nitrate/sulfonate/bicarbonate transport system substrate-binding protein
VDLEARGERVVVIPFKDLGVRIQATSVFVRRDFLEQNRAKLIGFVRATIKGTKYAFTNPEEAADIMIKHYRDLDKRVILSKWMKGRDYILSRNTELNGIGWQDPAKWITVQDVLYDSKLVDTKIDTSKAFDNSILTAIPLSERQMKKAR